MFEKRYWSSCLKSYGVVVKRMENTKYINLNAEQLRSKNAFALNIIIINSLIANALIKCILLIKKIVRFLPFQK